MEFTLQSRWLLYLFLILIYSLEFTVGGFKFDYDPDYFDSIVEVDGSSHVKTVTGPKGNSVSMY